MARQQTQFMEVQLLAQDDELPADVANGFSVVLAQVRYRFEIRCQAPGQPHQLDIALRFAFEPAARLDAVQVAVNVELEGSGANLQLG